jgi:hypothetical protein
MPIPDSSSNQRLILLLLAILIISVSGLAQSTGTGSIQGMIVDPKGTPVAAAKITITNPATSGVVRVTSSSAGAYTSGPLIPADYLVRIQAKGFKTSELNIAAQVGVASPANVKLQVGPETEVAKEEPISVNTEQSVVQGILKGNQIEDLPVNGHNLASLAQLEPGVQSPDAGAVDATKNGLSSISFQGHLGRATRTEVDGVDITDEIAGATTQNIPASAIQEVNLSQSSLDLSTELTPSGAVSVITRSGSNALHGEAFGLFRGNQVAADLPGTPVPTFQREQFGARAGGYVIKNQFFWFLDLERSKQDLTAAEPFAAPFNTLDASLAQPVRAWQGEGKLDWQVHDNAHAFYRFSFDQASDIRPAGASSSLQAFQNKYHTPAHALGYDFSTGPYNHSLRFGYLKFSDGITDTTASIPAGSRNPIPGLGINIGAPVAGNCFYSGGGAYCGGPSFLSPQTTLQSNDELRYDGSRVLGPHIVRFGLTYNRIQGGGAAVLARYPQVGTTSICLPGSTDVNCLTSSDPAAYPANNVLLGNGIGFSTASSAFGLAGGGMGPDNRIEAYLGDNWKFRNNFTLTYGLRYVRDAGRMGNLGSESNLNLWVPGLGNQVQTPNKNFAPQVGFAWDMSGNQKTVLRAGAGLYYDSVLWNAINFDASARLKEGIYRYTPEVCSSGVPSSFTWPSNPGAVGTTVAGGAGLVVAGVDQVQPTFCGQTISNAASGIFALSGAFQAASASYGRSQPNPMYLGTALSAANLSGSDVIAPTYRTPRSYQMNFGFQQELQPGTVLTVDLVRNIGEHFLLGIDQNHSGAARSYNQNSAQAARDAAQLANGCSAGFNQAFLCMVPKLGVAGAQAAYSAAGLDSNVAVTGGGPCSYCAFPGVTPNGQNNAGGGVGNGVLGTLDVLNPIGRSVYNGLQIKLVHNVQHPLKLVKAASFQAALTVSRFVSQPQDRSFVNLATDNDSPLRFTGPDGLDHRQHYSLGGSFDLPFFTHISLIGQFYSPLPQNLELPQLTNGGEIFASDWLGSGLGSGSAPEPLPGTQIGQFMRSSSSGTLYRAIDYYNRNYAGNLTPAGYCLVGNANSCPGIPGAQVMTMTDMQALNWVMPQLANVPANAVGFPWLKTLDLKAAWPIKLRERITIEPSASIFNVFNFANEFLPGNLPSASLMPGGLNGTFAPNSVGGVTGANLAPYRAGFQSGTYALGAPRQIEFGLRVQF